MQKSRYVSSVCCYITEFVCKKLGFIKKIYFLQIHNLIRHVFILVVKLKHSDILLL